MKKFLFIATLFFISFSSAINVTCDFPERVFVDENFSFYLETDSIQIYDVKVDILCEDKRISKIFYDNKWKSTMYYTDMSLKMNSSYIIKTENVCDSAEIVVKLRNYKGDVKEFDCGYVISHKKESTVEDEEIPDEETSEERENIDSDEEEEEEPEIKVEKLKRNSKIEEEKDVEEFKEEIKPIILNPKTIKKEEAKSIVRKGFAKYSIWIFCLILFLLYAFKFKEKKDEFR